MKNAQKKKRLIRRIPTAESLANAALLYLSRYAASEASLRRILHNKIRRAAMVHPEFASDNGRQASLRNDIETIIEKHRRTGVLNDAAYATSKISSMRRKGRSRNYIRNALSQKGIKSQLVGDALTEIDGGAENYYEAEMKAAFAFAKRKRLGPFRPGKIDEDRRRKDLASFARAGYSLEIARKVFGKILDEEE